MSEQPPGGGLFTNQLRLWTLLLAAFSLWAGIIEAIRTLIAHGLIWLLVGFCALIATSFGFTLFTFYAFHIHARRCQVGVSAQPLQFSRDDDVSEPVSRLSLPA